MTTTPGTIGPHPASIHTASWPHRVGDGVRTDGNGNVSVGVGVVGGGLVGVGVGRGPDDSTRLTVNSLGTDGPELGSVPTTRPACTISSVRSVVMPSLSPASDSALRAWSSVNPFSGGMVTSPGPAEIQIVTMSFADFVVPASGSCLYTVPAF